MIRIHFHACDNQTSICKSFKRLDSAAKIARQWVGRNPEIENGFAYSFDNATFISANVPLETLFNRS